MCFTTKDESMFFFFFFFFFFFSKKARKRFLYNVAYRRHRFFFHFQFENNESNYLKVQVLWIFWTKALSLSVDDATDVVHVGML